MADETPTRRLLLIFGSKGAVFTHGHLTNTPSGAPYPLALAHDDWAALAAALDPATTARLFDQRDAAITERDRLRAELKALKSVPRCGNTVDSVLSDTPHLVCDLPYGHPGTWHGCDQWYAGSVFPTRAEWVERTEERSELEHALVEVERMRPVLEAARAAQTALRGAPYWDDEPYGDALADLAAAVDVYNQPPQPRRRNRGEVMDVIAFLRARLDEDEQAARDAQPGVWLAGRTTEADWGPIVGGDLGTRYFADGEEWPKSVTVDGTHVCVNGPGGGQIASMARTRYRVANVGHVVRHDPARVLAEVAAKRAILEIHTLSTKPESKYFDDVLSHSVSGDRSLTVRGPNGGWRETGRTLYSCSTCDSDRHEECFGPVEGCDTLRAMVSVWADHRDFNPSWAIDRSVTG